MTEDCLTLTTFVGERKRAGGRFVADALLDLYERHEVATSILLRGMEGFGLRHHLRTDASLTLSEDLPAVAIAVDTAERITRVLDEAAYWSAPGLFTVERAGRYTDEPVPLESWPESVKLTVHLGRQDQADRAPAFRVVCELLHRHGVAGATTLLGVDGTVRGQRQRARFFGRNPDVPMLVTAVGARADIAQVLPELDRRLDRPLLTLQRVQICKRDGEPFQPPAEAWATDEDGSARWQKLTIYTSESQRRDGRPIHRAVTRRLRESGARGTTTLRGIWGYHGDHRPHGDRVLQFGRRVPAVTIVIDTPDRVARWFPVIDELTAEHGLVTSEPVPRAEWSL